MSIPSFFIENQMVLAAADAPALRRLQRAWLRHCIEEAKNELRICQSLAKSKNATKDDLVALTNASNALAALRAELAALPPVRDPRETTREEAAAAFQATIERKARQAREAAAAAEAARERKSRAPNQLEDLA